jgi:hypothetical protein
MGAVRIILMILETEARDTISAAESPFVRLKNKELIAIKKSKSPVKAA